MIISIQNQKGGVGKTTLAVHVSHALTLLGHLVLLVDGDPQGSARDWAAARQGEPLFPVIGLDPPGHSQGTASNGQELSACGD